MFKPLDPEFSLTQIEEGVLKFWKEEKIFARSLTKEAPRGRWNFLDGPPFITGLPHYGSLLSSIPKDLFPRFRSMQGYRVERRWGWDCHGLPAENKVEEKLGIKRKKDIEEKIGVKKFIEECQLYVQNVSEEWEWYVDHVGRFVDFKNSYKTMDKSYMETVLWVFKQVYEKGLIYKGLRVSLYCPHCATPISNFEVAMDADNYRDVTEPTAVYKYQLADDRETFFLAWSTTPWNKLATTALAVNPDLTYVEVRQDGENYILAETTVRMLTTKAYKIARKFSGRDLVGRKFRPHYDYYQVESGKKTNLVVAGDFVTAEEGTGIVTIAAYGEEDLAVMLRDNIQIVLHVDDEGRLKNDVPEFAGRYYLDVNPLVIADLQKRSLIYRLDEYTHSVPTCWRCHTRLYYSPQNAWYINIQQLKEKMKETNERVNWYPPHFKYGRYFKSLESAPDWCISRSRYWGSPLPVWECSCGERFVPGSLDELEKASGQKINDLHKPEIDEVTVTCSKCGQKARRVPEVLDSWIEAGSATLAERHFPFEKNLKLEDFFPPDFIVEYTGQIRAWFYVLHVIATALYEREAFKNVVVTGVILGTDGRKMSKNYGNYPDPKELLQKYGGDALRLYLMGSPVMRGEDILISEKAYAEQVKFLRLLLNVYNFFAVNAGADEWQAGKSLRIESFQPRSILDRWLLSRLQGNIRNLTRSLENFDTVDCVGDVNYERSLQREERLTAGNAGIFIVHDLSNWYLRRLRDRIGPTVGNGPDKDEAYTTLYVVLENYLRALAPFIPFSSEYLYRNLTGKDSVHLENWPALPERLSQPQLEIEMEAAMKLASKVHAFRKENKVAVKVPFRKLRYEGPLELTPEILKIVLAEVNVDGLQFTGEASDFTVQGETGEANQDLERGRARDFVRKVQELRKKAGCKITDRIVIFAPDWPKKFEDYLKRETLGEQIIVDSQFRIEVRKS